MCIFCSYYMRYNKMHCCIVAYHYFYVMVLRHTFMQVWKAEQVTEVAFTAEILDMTEVEQGLQVW